MPNIITYYRIRNWKDVFENNRTKELKNLLWVPVPIKHDGEGFQAIMQEKDGIVIYGCWHLILQTAAKSHPRGTLLRDDGTPLTAKSIALKTGWRRVEDIQRALDFCSSSEVGWIERLTKEGAGIPQDGAVGCGIGAAEGKGIEGNRIEEKHICVDESFMKFWEAYPRKTAKKAAEKAWGKAKDRPELSVVISAIEVQKQSEQWKKDGGQFIPLPATWLNQGRWSDQPMQCEPRIQSHSIRELEMMIAAKKTEMSRINMKFNFENYPDDGKVKHPVEFEQWQRYRNEIRELQRQKADIK